VTEAVVSTECPSCGAPLDFAHGANAIRCRHCRSNLLVTGHRQVLSYQIDPQGDGKAAADRVRAALGPGSVRLGAPRLYFVPYYRLTGHEFRWVRPAAPPPERGASIGDAFVAGAPADDHLTDDLLSALDWASALVARLLDVPAAPVSASRSPAMLPVAPGGLSQPLVFQDRYVDRSFLALDLPELGVPSLGVRASVLPLRLARPSAPESRGHLVAVEMAADVAVGLGMQPPEAHAIVHRTVIGRMLSIIHFPFWIVPLDEGAGSRLAVVDGVAESVVKVDASPSLLARLERLAPAVPETLGFRPLVCPNCGWDLPVRPDDVIFFCRSCGRTWQLHGAELHGIAADVADVPAARPGAPVKYLPCWILDASEDGRPGRRFFAPAFRYQRLKLLNDLGRRLSSRQPTWSKLAGEPPDLEGGHYDVEDAALLARFIGLAPGLPGGDAPGNITVTAATVTWFPFAVENRELLDPFTGLALPEPLLL
jgi:LSD1 subclass zinc finger protein